MNSVKLYRVPGADESRPFFIELPTGPVVLAVYDDHVRRVPGVPAGAEEQLWEAAIGSRLANARVTAPTLVTDADALVHLEALANEKQEDFDGPGA